MAQEKLPYFKWYPKDCDINENVRSMDDRELGFYMRCLNHSWVNGSLPADQGELARVMRCTRVYLAKVWIRVSRCFEPSQADPSRLVNGRQEEERVKALDKSDKASVAVGRRRDRGGPRYSSEQRPFNERRESVLPRALGRPGSGSESESSEGDAGGCDCRSITQQLWDIHPSPSEFGFVEAAVANEMRNSVHPGQVFAEKIVASLRAWVEYWISQKRYPIGLKKWVESGDYAKEPPYKASTQPQYETPEERDSRITREDADRRRK